MIKFKCPKCGCDVLTNVETNATVISLISDINEEGDFNYETPDIQESEVSHFECAECNFFPVDSSDSPINDNVEVAEWCKDNCPQE